LVKARDDFWVTFSYFWWLQEFIRQSNNYLTQARAKPNHHSQVKLVLISATHVSYPGGFFLFWKWRNMMKVTLTLLNIRHFWKVIARKVIKIIIITWHWDIFLFRFVLMDFFSYESSFRISNFNKSWRNAFRRLNNI